MINKISKLEDVFENVAIPTALSAVSINSPTALIIFTFIFGTAITIRKWQLNRIKEINKYVSVRNLLNLINNNDKTRDVLHKIIINILDEQSFLKRKLYYEYINNLSNGLYPDYNDHTKLIFTINIISIEEIHLLSTLNNIYNKLIIYANQNKDQNEKFVYDHNSGITITDIIGSNMFRNTINDLDLENSIGHLGSFDLIYIRPGRMNGTFYMPITKFGKIFLDFLL